MIFERGIHSDRESSRNDVALDILGEDRDGGLLHEKLAPKLLKFEELAMIALDRIRHNLAERMPYKISDPIAKDLCDVGSGAGDGLHSGGLAVHEKDNRLKRGVLGIPLRKYSAYVLLAVSTQVLSEHLKRFVLALVDVS